MVEIDPSEITPEHVYLSRRSFMKAAATVAAGNAVLAACGQPAAPATPRADADAPDSPPAAEELPAATAEGDELGDPLTPYDAVTTYNNFYEFSTDKEAPARLAAGFVTAPWALEVGGLVSAPRTFDLDALRAFGLDERVYRLRCVEGWSMVIPWLGFPLAKLLDSVEPDPEARYVSFVSALDREQMPGLDRVRLEWPYTEGLRLDEALNDLTILSLGLYGKELPPQNGAPVRLVVPWKYGFKSAKSIVRIELLKDKPGTTWVHAAPDEYGFYANVNPEVDHPRWSQATERRIGELRRRRTLMFNGYEDEVATLYEGMDLVSNF